MYLGINCFTYAWLCCYRLNKFGGLRQWGLELLWLAAGCALHFMVFFFSFFFGKRRVVLILLLVLRAILVDFYNYEINHAFVISVQRDNFFFFFFFLGVMLVFLLALPVMIKASSPPRTS